MISRFIIPNTCGEIPLPCFLCLGLLLIIPLLFLFGRCHVIWRPLLTTRVCRYLELAKLYEESGSLSQYVHHNLLLWCPLPQATCELFSLTQWVSSRGMVGMIPGRALLECDGGIAVLVIGVLLCFVIRFSGFACA